MKIKVFDRILIVILSLFVIWVSCITALRINNLIAFVEWYQLFTQEAVTIICAVVFVMALRAIVAALKRKPLGEPAPTAAHLETNEYGSTYVALAAIDSMVQRHCRSNPRVKDCASLVSLVNGGVKVAVKLIVTNECNIPELSSSLHQSLKAYVEELSGIKVLDAGILIVSAPPPKSQI